MLQKGLFEKKYIYKGKFEGFPFSNALKGYAVAGDFYEAAIADDISLVYISATWAELEPEAGKFDFDELFRRFHVEEYAKHRKRAVFRLLCDVPKSFGKIDIPEWLYRETKDGYWYNGVYGSGYSPNYNNSVFIEKHERLLKAINEAFALYLKGEFLAYVELGTIGHWGEWHTDPNAVGNEIGCEETLLQITRQYVEAFPKAKLLMRRPFAGAHKYGLGLYNDVTGAPVDTALWLDWINKGGNYNGISLYNMENFGAKMAIGGEFTSGLTWNELLGSEFERTKQLIAESHQTFLGPKCPHSFEVAGYEEQSKVISSILGYNLFIKEASVCVSTLTNCWRLKLILENIGIAAFQFDWPLVLYIYNRKGKKIHRIVLLESLKDIIGLARINQKLPKSGRKAKDAFDKMDIVIEDPTNNMPAVGFCNCAGKSVTIWNKLDYKPI